MSVNETPPLVLVVGAGPVGLTAAVELARRGIAVRLVDAAAGPATTSRAIATHPRTLEVYDQMGVVDDMLARGQRIQAFTLHANGRRLARLDADYSQMPTRFPFTLCIDQVQTEAVLRDTARGLGVEVEWGVRLRTFEQDAERVLITLGHADGTEERLAVPWLLGADGGHSAIRKRLGLPLLGEASETWLIADADVEADLPRNSIHWVRAGGLTMMMVPMSTPGRWRLLDTAGTRHDPTPEVVAARFTEQLSRGLGSPVRVAAPVWVSVFTFQQRMVTRMRDGRCLLAGDAAHVHSPASGQGMNTGIQEAHNLAWKLAAVVRGQAGPGLLDSYGDERVPVGAALLDSTRTATFLVQMRNAAAGVALPVVFGLVKLLPKIKVALQRKILGGVSGLRVNYQDSPLTTPDPARGAGRPRPGERLTAFRCADAAATAAVAEELRDLRWTALVGPAAGRLVGALADRGSWLSTRVVTADETAPGALPDRDGLLAVALALPPGGWVLARPDGYVAARGDRPEVADVLAALVAADGSALPTREAAR
ncbi:Salicylate hydroxylase [Actinokineospora spheciospongiae]|uniref:Salicylate hydroxylase n=1 Tax=Actinokineospora spheciospongiae TaxID=909613 RepID=W7IQY3_9PSEU|nr:FAD-dependent oxidoreductase [Actinokineospora spheciospongiae]EWC63315.1 Salicylate hydroxylase [Actinokineospora spheciospongiae]